MCFEKVLRDHEVFEEHQYTWALHIICNSDPFNFMSCDGLASLEGNRWPEDTSTEANGAQEIRSHDYNPEWQMEADGAICRIEWDTVGSWTSLGVMSYVGCVRGMSTVELDLINETYNCIYEI